MKFNLKDNFTYVIMIVLVILLVAVGIGLIVSLNKGETDKTLNGTSFTVGSLTANGEVNADDTSKTSAYTSFIGAEGLKVELTEDAPLTYTVYYYTANKTLISDKTQTGLDSSGKLSVPVTAKYARIMVKLNGGARFGALGMAEYMRYVTITVKK